jgi:hypothetical protein
MIGFLFLVCLLGSTAWLLYFAMFGRGSRTGHSSPDRAFRGRNQPESHPDAVGIGDPTSWTALDDLQLTRLLENPS